MAGRLTNPMHEKLIGRLSIQSGIGKEEISLLLLRIVNMIKHDLLRSGEATVPHFGKFYIKRLPPRRRKCYDFVNEKHYYVDVPAQDQLKFKINKEFSKLFR